MKTAKRMIRSGSCLLMLASMLVVFSFPANAREKRPVQLNAGNGYNINTSVAAPIISLTLDPSSTSGKAQLKWTVEPPGNYEYRLIRTDPSGISEIIYQGPNSSFTDIITFPYCVTATNLIYRVELADGSGTVSNQVSGGFKDNTPPADPILDSISIDPYGHPVISWTSSVSKDVAGYEIQLLFPNGSWKARGLSMGTLTGFTADTLDACSGVKTFAILTVDKCDNRSTGEVTKKFPLNTLILEPPAINYCDGTAVLNWNKYNNMNPALGGYRIYRKAGAAPFSLIGITPADVTNFTDKPGFTIGVRYSYYIRAFSQDGKKSSSSCISSFIFASQPLPNSLSLNYVSVTDKQHVEMAIHFGPLETVKTLQVLRSETADGPFDTIAAVPREGSEDIVIEDTTAEVDQHSYYYKINVLDKCDAFARASDVARTIFLICRTNSDETHSLTWNDYEGWPGGVDHYEINRIVNGIADPANPIGSTGAATFLDPAPSSQQEEHSLAYYVTAIGKDVAAPARSVSNTVQAIRQPHVMMPNAFVPRGIKNNRFRPVMDYFVDEANYQLLIYNKWWQQVFVSTDKSIGWDGKYDGEYAPGGIYFYRLNYRSLTGESFSKTGLLMLVE